MTWTLLLCLLSPVCVAAQTTFYEAYEKGLQLEKAGDWTEARGQFLQATSLRPIPARRVRTYGLNFLKDYDPFVHLAHCEIEMGLYEDAVRHLEVSRRAGLTPGSRLLQLKERLERELEKRRKATTPSLPAPTKEEKPVLRAPVLKTESKPSGATVKIDGEEQGITPLQATLTTGRHHVEYSLEGYESTQQTIDLEEGQTQTVTVMLSALPPRENKTSEPEPPRTSSVKPPVAKPESNEVSSESPKADAVKTPEMTVSAPVQNKLPASAPIRSAWRRNRNWILLLLMTAILVGFLALRKAGSNSSYRGELTQDLRLDKSLPVNTPTPVSKDALNEMKMGAKQLPEGARKDLGNYELQAILGRGGMATTFLAIRKRDALPVAVKIPHEHLLDHPEFTQRFLREGSLGSTLHHPNIIRVLEAGKTGNKPFIAMELVKGETLEKQLTEKGRLPLQEALEVARDVALALDYARLKGIVHRDLKPENIMILERGGLKLLDFGIARILNAPGLTSSEAFLGTPSYSAPESTRSEEIDQQTDLYSLGIILYRCLSGVLPFRSQNVLEILQMHRSQPLPPFPPEAGVPASVFQIVKKLTAKQKKDRFLNAESFLIEMNQILNQLED